MPPANGWSVGFGTNYGAWAEKDWTVDHRVSPNLVSFDGQINHYDDWRYRVHDNFVGANLHYREVFDFIENSKQLTTLTAQLTWVNSELSKYNDPRLSKWNMLKLLNKLKP